MSLRIAQFLILLALVVPGASPAAGQQPTAPRLAHPTDLAGRLVSGDGATVHMGHETVLRARVTDGDGRPLEGVRVHFDQVSPKSTPLAVVATLEDGIATLVFEASGKPGPYAITARIGGGVAGRDQIAFRIEVRKSSWAIFMLFGLAGGLGIFLFGMDMMSRSMQRSAGGRMRAVLGALTANRLVGVGVGAFVTMVIQSSSATTVMLVSFVQAQLMPFAQTVGVILGADIGTTVTAQLIAFKLTDYALLMIAVGFGLRMTKKSETVQNAGAAILGFGLLFFGMFVMSESMVPLRTYQPFLYWLQGLENPLLGIMVGTAFTALIQSSSAFTGVVIVLAQQGLLTLEAGIPLIFGANIGTCVTALLASIAARREAKRVAFAHIAFKVLGVLLVVGWIPQFAELVRGLSGGAVADADTANLARVIPRQIANAHTVFNVGLALIFLPFTRLAARAIERVLPDREEPEVEPHLQARFLDQSMLTAPTLALNLAKVEILRMGEMVKRMAAAIIDPFLERDLSPCDTVHELEEEVDALDPQITAYLIEIGKQNLNQEQAEEVYLMMHVTKQWEHMADIIDKDLRPLARRRVAEGIEFSESGKKEVRAYHLKVMKQISRGIEAIKEKSLKQARKMTKKQAKYVALEGMYRQAHFERVQRAVVESVGSSEIHLDLMDALRKINSYSANIARAMLALEQAPSVPEASKETGKKPKPSEPAAKSPAAADENPPPPPESS